MKKKNRQDNNNSKIEQLIMNLTSDHLIQLKRLLRYIGKSKARYKTVMGYYRKAATHGKKI